MTTSPEAKHAPVGALRGGLLLLVVGALLAWWSPGEVPGWVWVTTIFVGGVVTATALGIRMLRA